MADGTAAAERGGAGADDAAAVMTVGVVGVH